MGNNHNENSPLFISGVRPSRSHFNRTPKIVGIDLLFCIIVCLPVVAGGVAMPAVVCVGSEWFVCTGQTPSGRCFGI